MFYVLCDFFLLVSVLDVESHILYCTHTIGDLNWGYENKTQDTTIGFGCVDAWYCNALNANNTHKCANIDLTLYNVRECDNYTIDTYDISYTREFECCQYDYCNNNYSSSIEQCTHDSEMKTIEETIETCKNSYIAVNSVYSRWNYCPTSEFFETEYHYCEYVATYGLFGLGCTWCEGYSHWYNNDIIKGYIEMLNEKDAINNIDTIIDSLDRCCEIEYNCNYDNNTFERTSVLLTKYFVAFELRINGTTENNYDETELIDELAIEMGINTVELNITDVAYFSKEVSTSYVIL